MRTASYQILCLALALAVVGCNKLGYEKGAGLGKTSMIFGCLSDTDGGGEAGDVSFNRQTSTVSMTWKLPKKAHGNYIFKIYDGATNEVLKQTTDNQWDFKVRSDEVRTYQLYVEALDQDGETDCYQQGKVVTVAVNEDVGAPEMLRTWAFPVAHNRILLVWEKSPSLNVARYDIFPYENLFNAGGFDITDPISIGNTVKNYYFVDSLQPASSYRFIVKAVNTAGVRSPQKQDVTVTTLNTDRPMFNGAFALNKVGGMRGLDSLDIRLSPSVDPTVTGYRVFMNTGTLDYDVPFSLYSQQVPEGSIFSDTAGYYVPRLSGGLPVETIRVSALTPDTSYCVVLRAFRGGVPGNPLVVEEENNLRMCNKTNTVKAPTFLGISQVRPSDGAAGFTSVEVSYAPPDSDGVWNLFKIQYKEFATDPGPTCAGQNMTGALVKMSNDDQDYSVPITTDINPLKFYCVQVNAVYTLIPGVTYTDTNTKLLRVLARPDPPSFNGVIQVVRTPSAFGEMFDSVDIYHGAATGSFSKYRYQVSKNNTFTDIVKDEDEIQRETVKHTVTGLPKKTQLYARVLAVFEGPDMGAGPVILTDVDDTTPPRVPKFLAINTTPAAPANDGVKQLHVVNPRTLEIEGQLATNAGATWSENVFWLVSEKGPGPGVSPYAVPNGTGGYFAPEEAIQMYKTLPPQYVVTQASPTRTTTKVQITGLESNIRYCAMFRSRFDLGGDTLDSLSNSFDTSKNCTTPTLTAASFSGITGLYNRNDPAGFTQLWAKFPKLPSSNQFSRYRIAWEQSPDGTTQPPIVFAYDGSGSPSVTLESFDASGSLCTFASTACCVKGASIHCPIGPDISTVAKNKTIFAKVAVEFEFEGKAATRNGVGSAPGGARTTPALPTTPGFSAKSGGSTSLLLNIVAPENPEAADAGNPDILKGLWNNIFIYLATDDATANSLLSKGTYNPDLKAYVPAESEIAYVANAKGEFEISQGDQEPPVGCVAPADCRSNIEKGLILRAPRKVSGVGAVDDGPTKSAVYIRGLIPLGGTNNYRMRARAVYWNGVTNEYVQSTEASASANPQGGAPQFSGFGTFSKYHDANDFTKLRVNVTQAVGECTRLEALVYPKAYDASYTAADWLTGKVEQRDCLDTVLEFDKSDNVDPLVPGGEYYVRIRAVNQVISTIFASGQDVRSPLAVTLPDRPNLADLVSLSHTPVANAADTLTLTYNNSTVGDFNRVIIFRNEGNYTGNSATDTATQNALKAALILKMKKVNVGGRAGPDAVITPDPAVPTVAIAGASLGAAGEAKQYNFTQALAGRIYCFSALSVFTATSTFVNDQYLSSLPLIGATEDTSTVEVMCKQIIFKNPNVADVAVVASTQGACANAAGSGTNAIKLQLQAPVASDSTVEKWQIFAVSGADYVDINSFGNLNAEPWDELTFGDDSDPDHGDFSASGYLMVGCRGKTIGGNTRYFVRWVNAGSAINDTATNRISGNLNAGSNSNFVWIPKANSGLAYPFVMGTYEASYLSGVAGGESVPAEGSLASCNTSFHSSGSTGNCGTGSSLKVMSAKNKNPMTADWKTAWWACRQSSQVGILERLPTEVEWRRAARWAGDVYSTQFSTYDVACNTHRGGISLTGNDSSCKSVYGVYDMAGRVREWVDARIVPYNVTELRFGWGPSIGRMIDNGIDRLTARYHLITPPAGGSGLLMGSDTSTVADYQTQVDAETQYWAALSTSNNAVNTATPITGFRCMGMLKSMLPSASQLALPQEPAYVASDLLGTPDTWTVPEGRFVKDVRPETVQILVTDDAAPAGKVQISWKPWTKAVGSDSITYDIYRVIEPTHTDYRFATSWALPQDLSLSPYPSAKLLDPLAITSSGTPIWSAEKVAADLTSGSSNCTSTSGPLTVPYTTGAQTRPAPGAPCYQFDYTGVEAKRMYMYVVVAKDSSGNQMHPMVQRFRSPYFAGDFSAGGKAAFRHEIRWRRASIGAVAEGFQLGKTIPQTMAHIPMDQSGHDHDYYIQKYEAYRHSGVFGNAENISNNPPVTSATIPGAWISDLAVCHESKDREPLSVEGVCGPMSTTAKFGSKSGMDPIGFEDSPASAVSYASLWQGCHNSYIEVEDGASIYRYNLHSQTGVEYLKAADWGDADFDGFPDRNPHLSASDAIRSLEFSPDGLAGTACYTEAFGGLPNPVMRSNTTGSRSKCVSRYGVMDMVGNALELTAERSFRTGGPTTVYFQDNGVDALWLNMRELSTGGSAILSNIFIDLVRGIPNFSPTATSADGAILGGDLGLWYPAIAEGSTSSVGMGGAYKERWLSGIGPDKDHAQGMGRFARSVDSLAASTSYNEHAVHFGGRCAR